MNKRTRNCFFNNEFDFRDHEDGTGTLFLDKEVHVEKKDPDEKMQDAAKRVLASCIEDFYNNETFPDFIDPFEKTPDLKSVFIISIDDYCSAHTEWMKMVADQHRQAELIASELKKVL
jgi:hypothetical protein